MRFDYEKFYEWEESTTIPEGVMKVVKAVSNELGFSLDEADVETITYRNRGGHPYAYAKGLTLTHCTSSLETGPTEDYSGAFIKWLGGLGFEIVNSYGDNGMDSVTNWHDTYWSVEIAYTPSMVYDEKFYEYDDEDYED